MLNRTNPLEQKQARIGQLQEAQTQDLYERCRQGDRGACQQLMGGEGKSLLEGSKPIGYMSQGYADGGNVDASLLAPSSELAGPAPEEMGMGDDMEMMGDQFLPLMEILGEDGFAQLEEAIAMHPVVALVAEMAMKTSDGAVEGLADGSGSDDQVPARLTAGEYVFSVPAVEVLGLENLEALHEKAKAMAASQ